MILNINLKTLIKCPVSLLKNQTPIEISELEAQFSGTLQLKYLINYIHCII